jgi:hypothetical protein
MIRHFHSKQRPSYLNVDELLESHIIEMRKIRGLLGVADRKMSKTTDVPYAIR